ncbi:protein kinase [Sorangium sp. So ce296]|uniref:serine/threonine-protein kinase n=1 Tax=Sorangium sp. So ce296 TaxID=3133296 RepID=UPI003F64311D
MDDERAACERRVGTTLRGKWTIDRLLGIGGMAAVYAATHKIGRREAIKILHPEVARSKDLRARFEREAQAVNRFRHPGVVEIRDIDMTEDGAPFLVMELLDGESLADRLQRLGHIETGEMLRLMDELLDVLGAAHDQGIIHRDIKLDNLFVERTGRLKVLDFGIARMRDGVKTAMRTRTGATLGTVSYMAPEQVRGISVDHRADLFAAGATMFRLIAKRRIHEARTESELLVKMATMAAPPLASVAPEAPPGLCALVDRALAFDRDRRYPDARTMQADMRALLRGEPPPFASARLAAGDTPSAGAPQPSPMLAAPASVEAPAEPPPRPAAPSGARWNEMGSAPAIGPDPGPGGATSWEAATVAAPGAQGASVMDAAQARGGHPSLAQIGPGAPNGPPSALHNTGAGHAGMHGAPASLHGGSAPHSAPAALHNTGASYGAPAALHNTGASYGAPAALHNTGASYGAPAALHNTGASYGAPAALHNTGASYGAPAALHNTGASYGAPAALHAASMPHSAPASLHNTGASYGAPAASHAASMPHSAPASLHNTGASYGAPASQHAPSAPYGEQPAAGWAPRRAPPKQPPKLVILLAIGGVALVIASVVAVWMALRDEPKSDAVQQHDLLPAQSASERPTQLSPSEIADEPPRALEAPETMRPDPPGASSSAPPPVSTIIIDLKKKRQTRKPHQD